MENGIIKCPKCETKNSVESDICYVCGASLHAPPPSKNSRIWLLIVLLMIGGAVFYVYYRTAGKAPPALKTAAKPPVASDLQPAPIAETAQTPSSEKSFLEKQSVPQAESQKITLPVGVVLIKDITGQTISQLPATVVAGSWIALPRKLCQGGYEWVLQLDSGEAFSIMEGILGQQDQVGIWRIQGDKTITGLKLSPVASDQSLLWVALQSEPSSKPTQITVIGEQDHFMKGTLTGDITEPGVLLQGDACVGWTFGSLLEGGFLWIGNAGENLEADLRVDDFYRATFANSREEELIMAQAMGDEYTPLERLVAFANAFRFDSRLTADETPAQLQPEPVISAMRELVEQLAEAGFAFEVASAFDAQVLINAADISLLADVVRVTAEGSSFEDAAELIEDVADHIQFKTKADLLQLGEIRSEVFQNWINSTIEDGDLQAGLRAFELASQNLPDDLKIHLLGVRLALAGGDWATAERLLVAKQYPVAYNRQVQNLQNQISELKGQAGKIVINFTPGSQQIELTATLDRDVKQQFIIDTGASQVTIPQSTAELLGLTIDERNPIRKVATAGGMIDAPEVILPSIEIEGWTVSNVKALVVDLPDQAEWGLLGLNYLEKFRMDLDNEKGVLLLEPR